MSTSSAGPAHPVSKRPRRRVLGTALSLSLALLAGCGDSKFQYVSNSANRTYLKVPKEWKQFDQGVLVRAEIDAARAANKPASFIDALVSRRVQWRVAFDGSPSPSIDHTLELAREPVVEVSVRALDPDERIDVSLAALRNVIVKYDELKQQSLAELTNMPLGTNPRATTKFRSIDEEELNLPDGLRGVRLRYLFRPTPSDSFYAFDQTTLIDARAEHLYVLLIRSGEAQFLRQNGLFTEIAKSFTVKAKG